ncbi:MAG: primosomal protein N' [Oscillospiraceae bacterium]|nr:primosomal protein N' [Oscillospiraceae bacterium]
MQNFGTEKTIAKVAIDNAAYHFDRLYDYRIPAPLCGKALAGMRVTVPFGTSAKKRQGMIMELADGPDGGAGVKIKSIAELLDDEPLLSGELLELAAWLKERTFCTYYDAVKAMLPAGLNHKIVESYAAVPGDEHPPGTALSIEENAVLKYLSGKKDFVRGEKVLADLGLDKDSAILNSLVKKGCAARNYDAVRRTGDLTVKMMRLTPAFLSGELKLAKLSGKQSEVADLLSGSGQASVREICYFTGFTPSVPMSLVSKGAAELYENQVYRNPYAGVESVPVRRKIVLTGEQETAYQNLLDQYRTGKGSASLLFGVTGSGKTKVYMRLIDEIAEEGRGVILMVPEIALTPQALKLFHERYGKRVAVFHSALSVGERLDEWRRVKSGEACLVVGTRSAVFAPFDDLGLIIIDEEQESAYKSENTPRYSARDAAKFRCHKHNALLILASATPSVESYAAAVRGKYTLNALSKRYGAATLPKVETVDMFGERMAGNTSELSGRLLALLKENLAAGQQSILLINRRGYNTFASCTSCRHVLTCPSCSISMTYHHANGRLMCHYCGYSAAFTPDCPACGKPAVKYAGFGTQKVEDDLQKELPGARILRLDTDTTMSRFAHEEKLKRFAAREFDILLGTQMVAKGLDFENVTLAGVVSVDQQLYNDDFRSLERAFALLTQVVGRSGRGKYEGRAVIQTLTPENDIISLAVAQDYVTFFNTEIGIRKALVYPPYCELCVVGFVGEDELFVRSASKEALALLKRLSEENYAGEKFIVLGPMPARVAKVSNKFRYRMIIKCRNTPGFRAMIADILRAFGKDPRFSNVTVYADMNPESLI